ncbi:MAG: glycosyltransferase [Alphaproteobacteria bacterium]
MKVAVLVDLLRSAEAGGHVKGWERLAAVAARLDLPLQLTVYFSGERKIEILSPKVRIKQLPQVFSTAKLKFLPYLPDHTDLAPWHPALAFDLPQYDAVHTTDAYFAFTRTAERMKRTGFAMTHSFHTDQPSYARIFTAKAIRDIFGKGAIARLLIDKWKLPERKAAQMERQRDRHLGQCEIALATRPLDRAVAERAIGPQRVRHLRLGADKAVFNPGRGDRAKIMARYQIPEGRIIIVFVGRMDEGKNIYTLIAALEELIAAGLPLHLVTAGIGPAEKDVRERLSGHATVPGFIKPDELAELYASADVMALASEVEIRSMAMVESLASGLPVLVAAKSGLDKLFAPTQAIRTVTGGADAWAAALREFATTGLREIMQAAARDYGAAHIASWEQVLAEDLFPAWRDAARRR